MKISEHFTLDELTRSSTATRLGIQNTPDVTQMANMQALCKNILEPLFQKWPRMIVTSCFRSPELNKAIGGAKGSQHMAGQAADIIVPGMSPLNVCLWIEDHLPYDQLIQEFPDSPSGGWTHVSWAPIQRKSLLTATKVDGHTVYSPGLNPTKETK